MGAMVMGIEFHCSKCGKLIRARGTAGGKRGKCPYCKQSVYIPTPPEEIEEVPLAPIDEADAARERRLEDEARRLATELGREEGGKYDTADSPGDAPTGGDIAMAPPRDLELDVPTSVNEYLSAMADSDMDRADTVARHLTTHVAQARKYVQRLVVDELPPAELSHIPAAVYKGFLRELVKRLK